MFNLDEALRNHLARRQKEPNARFVAASVATLSPGSKPGKKRVVAAVAGFATSLPIALRKLGSNADSALRSIEIVGN